MGPTARVLQCAVPQSVVTSAPQVGPADRELEPYRDQRAAAAAYRDQRAAAAAYRDQGEPHVRANAR